MAQVWLKQAERYDYKLLVPILHSILEESGLAKELRPGATVLLKPNLLAPREPDKAVTTHPIFIEALISILQKRGVKVKIFDSPGGPYSKWMLKNVYEASGIAAVAGKTGAELNWNFEEINISRNSCKLLRQLTIAKAVTEADIIINLPKFKTHGLAILTGAVKNMFGCIPGLKKAEFHFRFSNVNDLADALIDIAFAIPSFTIMDAVTGMEGAGPGAGDPRNIGLIIAGPDPVAVDLVMAKLAGLETDDVPVLRAAKKRGILPEWSKVFIQGADFEKVKLRQWKLPPTAGQVNAIGNIVPPRYRELAMRNLQPKPYFIKRVCAGCGECVRSCPAKCLKIVKGKANVDLSQCIRCFCCQELCSYKAVKIKRPLLARLLFKF